MRFNVELKTYDEFKKFWETISEREGYYFSDLLGEFDLGHLVYEKELDFEDDDSNNCTFEWNDTIDEVYLTHYFFSMDDSSDRMGDVKVRLFIPMINAINLDDFYQEVPFLEKRYSVLAKKFDKAMSIHRKIDAGVATVEEFEAIQPTESEFNEMDKICEKLYYTYGLGIEPLGIL